NGSLINGFSLSVSIARAPATPSAVAPTLSVISQLSSSVLAMLNLPTRSTSPSHRRRDYVPLVKALLSASPPGLPSIPRNADWPSGVGMAEQSYAIDVGHPPQSVLRVVNPILSMLLRTPLAGPARKQLMVLSFTGRKTGRRYSIPVSAHLIDNDLYAL